MRARSQESAFAWTSSAPPPPHPCTELKYRWKSKLACAKSRESAKTLQKPMRNATHIGKLRKIRCELESSCIQCSLPPQKPMRKQNANSIPREERAKTRVSAHASPEIAPPRAAADATTATSTEGTLWMIPGPVLCFSC